MKVMITGCNGQLGSELQASCPAYHELVCVDLPQLDISDDKAVSEFLKAQQPQVIINAAAYTAVDKAESDQALSYAVNADGAGNLARGAQQIGARFIQISTDFIFSGEQSSPYQPDDQPGPMAVYGASKLAGEQQVLTENASAVIIRTAWVYSRFGGNFVKTMLRLMAEREELSVVSDQVGTPCWAAGLATVIWRFLEREELQGIYHWTDAGVASWYDFAVAIEQQARELGLLEKPCTIKPISSADYPTPAKRPAYSVLDKTSCWQASGLEGQHWQLALGEMLQQLQQQQ